MSFGFSIGDFIAAAQLAHRIYNDIYLVARGAPEALQLLNSEMGMLALSLDMMIEEIKNPNSPLVLAGEKRAQMVNGVMKQTNSTLKDLELFAKKYDFGKRNEQSRVRRVWDKAKWALEAKSVDSFRAQITRHNGSMNLLLTAAGNSSLERIEKISNKMLATNDSIQNMIHPLPLIPLLSGIDEKASQIALTEAFMREANRIKPWYITGFNDWLNAARWWLMKAQTQLYSSTTRGSTIPAQAYANLLKASFILIDIFPQHPQRRLWQDEYLQVELLAAEMKQELMATEQLGLLKPNYQDILGSDLRIWAEIPPTINLVPVPRQNGEFQGPGSWCAQEDEEILWRGFGSFATQEQQVFEECIFLVLTSSALQQVRILGQSQRGLCLMSTPISLDSISENQNLILCTEPIGEKVGHSMKINKYTITIATVIDHLSLSAVFRGITVHQNCSGFGNSLPALIVLFAIATSSQAVLTQVSHYIKDFQFIRKRMQIQDKGSIYIGVLKLLSRLEASNTSLCLDEITSQKLAHKDSYTYLEPLSTIDRRLTLENRQGTLSQEEKVHLEILSQWLYQPISLLAQIGDATWVGLLREIRILSKNVKCRFSEIAAVYDAIFDNLSTPDSLQSNGPLEPEALYEFMPMLPPGFYHDTRRDHYRDEQLLTYLDISAWCGSIKLLQRLLEHERSSTANHHLLRAFHLAVANGHEHAAKLFLERGIDPNERSMNDFNSSSSSVAMVEGPEVAHRMGNNALELATKNRHVGIVKLLLESGADPHLRYGFDGWNLIHISASQLECQIHDAEVMIKLLAKTGISIHGPALGGDFYGDLPLHLATYAMNIGAVIGLLKEGANVDAKNAQGQTALHAYVRSIDGPEKRSFDSQEHSTLVGLLIDYSADIESKDSMGWTPLERASLGSYKKSANAEIYVRTLLNKGAAINGSCRNGQGWSPLALAVFSNKLELARILLQRGAKVTSAQLGQTGRPGGPQCEILCYFTMLDLVFYRHASKAVPPFTFYRKHTIDARLGELLISHGASVTNIIKRTCQEMREARLERDRDALKLLEPILELWTETRP